MFGKVYTCELINNLIFINLNLFFLILFFNRVYGLWNVANW